MVMMVNPPPPPPTHPGTTYIIPLTLGLHISLPPSPTYFEHPTLGLCTYMLYLPPWGYIY